jgi:LacI family transcriptional regulator
VDAATAVDHLQNHGHDLIGCIVGPPRIRSEALRLGGWRTQQHRNDGFAGDELVTFADQSEAGGASAARLLLSDHGRPATLHGRRPTALFVASDIQAIGVLWACHELGVRVPEDVAVVSLGGTRAAAYAIPTLTTVRQDVGYLAGAACAQLLRLVQDPAASHTHLCVRGNLVVGQTCGCTAVGST